MIAYVSTNYRVSPYATISGFSPRCVWRGQCVSSVLSAGTDTDAGLPCQVYLFYVIFYYKNSTYLYILPFTERHARTHVFFFSKREKYNLSYTASVNEKWCNTSIIFCRAHAYVTRDISLYHNVIQNHTNTGLSRDIQCWVKRWVEIQHQRGTI